MKTYLLRFSTKGIKNIDKVTSIDFYNNSISKGKNINLENKNIKGIFGNNGAGKSAFILSIDIYNTLTSKNDYLVQDIIKKKLEKLINKATNELFLENIFAVSKEEDINKVDEILRHTIIIKPYINEYGEKKFSLIERLEKLKGTTINTDYEELYKVENGVLTISNDMIDKNWFIEEYSKRLDQSTLTSYTITSLMKHENVEMTKNRLLTFVFAAFYNSYTTEVFIDNEDIHENLRINDFISNSNNKRLDLFKHFDQATISLKLNEDIIKVEQLENYRTQVKLLKEFIKILKPNLIDIKIDKKYDGEKYHCKKKFVYNDYEVDEECESTGIKRIIKMYTHISLAIKGYKVFIDELDANISGVFLDKMLEFFAENGKGQLCFTTHNILSMNILKKYKNSITVIGETGKVVNVVKNGHYQPVNLFYEGFIEDSPFNINSFDFFKSFDLEV